MIFELNMLDLGLLFCVTALILLSTSVLLSKGNSKANILINTKRLKNVAILFSMLFLATEVVQIFNIVSY